MVQRSVAFILSTIFLIFVITFIHGKSIRKLSPDTEYWDKFSNYLNDKLWPEGETYENYIILIMDKMLNIVLDLLMNKEKA